ncbi:MAG: hypothetical protein AABY15_08870 [Nanoarchaeota archaeon]
MALTILIKVYNKDGKVKLAAHTTDTIKVVNIYKYEEETRETHSFTYFKDNVVDRFVSDGEKYSKVSIILGNEERRKNSITYYDYIRTVNDVFVERLWITNEEIEHWEVVGDMEEIKITKKLESGNVYEERRKCINGDVYKTEFKNGEMIDFSFKVKENKIQEYLEKLRYGKQKN